LSCGKTPVNIAGFPAFSPKLAHEGPGFRPEYFEALATLESSNFWFRARNRLIINALRRHFSSLEQFLEIGCGTGFVLSGVAEAFPSARLSGTEIFSAGLALASRRVPQAEFLQADARHLPYDTEFDVIGAFDVLEHIPEDSAVIAQMYQAMRPGGGIVVTVPQHSWLWSKQDELAEHVRRYSAKELHGKIVSAGFRVVEIRSFVSLLLPLMWLSRHFGDVRGRNRDAISELRLSSLSNFIFGTVMTAEYVLGQLGVYFPAGGSLLVVAKKE